MNRQEALLVQTMEECAHIQHVCYKILRFGWDGDNIGEAERTNEQQLKVEYNDLICLMRMLSEEGFSLGSEGDLLYLKRIRVERYLKLSEAIGTVV